MTTNPSSDTYRCGTAAIVGRPNVGKSTLLNAMVGEKVAIVSPRPGTTRDRLLGVVTRPEAQIAFLDTPGFGKTKTFLDKRLKASARGAWAEAEVLILVMDARAGLTAEDRRLIEELPIARGQSPAGTVPIILAINKVDRVKKPTLLPLMAEAAGLSAFAEIIPVSAETGDGVDRLLAAIIARLPQARPHYPAEFLTDRSVRFLAAELIREQALLVTREEVPHALAVQIEEFRERRRQTTRRVRGHQRRGPSQPMTYIRALVLVERDSQKAIVVGAHGARLKAIGTAARRALEALIGQPVYLDLWVKVWPRWRESPEALRQLSY